MAYRWYNVLHLEGGFATENFVLVIEVLERQGVQKLNINSHKKWFYHFYYDVQFTNRTQQREYRINVSPRLGQIF